MALTFGLALLLAGAMVNPEGLYLWGLLTYAAVMLVLLPFVAWPIFVQAAAFPPAGQSRSRSVLTTWIGGTLLAVSAIFWIASVLDYDPSGRRVDWSRHILIPYWPRFGIALGLFCVCMLAAFGVAGAVSPILRHEVAMRGAVIGGIVLFGIVYGAGCILAAAG